jgi:ABC-2 type transport system permease protein
MYSVITNGATQEPIFAYIYLGNALYILVVQVLSGLGFSVVEDRERYRTMKQLYTTPLNGYYYLMGRGVARFLMTSLSVAVTLGFGIVFLQLQVSLPDVHWGLFICALVLGVAMLAMMGLALASIVLVIAHHSWLVGEAVAAALFLFCGAVFPLEVLPWWLRPVGYVMPVTYWLELVRRSLVGRVAHDYPTLSGMGDGQLLVLVAILTSMLGAIATTTFRHCDLIARERGLIDRTTNY